MVLIALVKNIASDKIERGYTMTVMHQIGAETETQQAIIGSCSFRFANLMDTVLTEIILKV